MRTLINIIIAIPTIALTLYVTYVVGRIVQNNSDQVMTTVTPYVLWIIEAGIIGLIVVVVISVIIAVIKIAKRLM
jgi:uncharacterized membrane protein YhdT